MSDILGLIYVLSLTLLLLVKTLKNKRGQYNECQTLTIAEALPNQLLGATIKSNVDILKMAKLSLAVVSLAILFAIFLALDVIAFGVTIGLAWYGIEQADGYLHAFVNISEVELTPSAVGASPQPSLQNLSMISNDEYLYWMTGATVSGMVWACINVVTLIALSELIRTHLALLAKLEKIIFEEAHELELIPTENSKATPVPPASLPSSSPTSRPTPAAQPESEEFQGPDNMEGFTDEIGGFHDQEWLNKPLRHFGPLSVLLLFLSSVSLACAFLCLTWGIAISFNHVRQTDSEKNASTFIIVDILVAVALPVFLCTSITSIAVVLEYITIGHLDLRTIIPRLVGIIKFECGKKFDYWVIDDLLYYPLEKKEDRSDKGCWFVVDKSPATWFLAIIIGTAFNLVLSYFVDLTLDTQITVSSCDDPLIDHTFDCFNASTLNFVDCVNNKQAVLLHCFKFHRFGIDTNIISAISTSYAFYLVTIATFKHIFSVVRNLIHVKPSRYWGAGFLGIGFIFYVGSTLVLIFWIRGYAADTISELKRLNIVHIWQFFMVSTFVTMVGGLLLSKWYEKLHTKVHARPVEMPLVHYNDTQRRHLYNLGSSDTWPPKPATE